MSNEDLLASGKGDKTHDWRKEEKFDQNAGNGNPRMSQGKRDKKLQGEWGVKQSGTDNLVAVK